MELKNVDLKLVSSQEILYTQIFEGIAYYDDFNVEFSCIVEITAFEKKVSLNILNDVNYPLVPIIKELKKWVLDNGGKNDKTKTFNT